MKKNRLIQREKEEEEEEDEEEEEEEEEESFPLIFRRQSYRKSSV